jgi:serine/threonine-protein kinase
MGSRTAFAMVGWLVAAAAATVAGLGAVRVIGEGITGTAATTLTQEEVAEALAETPAPTPPATSPAAPAPTPTATPGADTLLTHDAGRVMARCGGGLVTLVSWWPAQGYQVTDYDRGPAEEAEVTFERGSEGRGSGEVELHISCRDGTPQITRVDD